MQCVTECKFNKMKMIVPIYLYYGHIGPDILNGTVVL